MPFADDIPIQYKVNYDKDQCLVDGDADAYFELQEDELFKVLPVITEDAKLPSIAKFV